MDSIRGLAAKRFHSQRFQDWAQFSYEILTIPATAHGGVSPTTIDSAATLNDIERTSLTHPPLLLVQIQYDRATPVHTFHCSSVAIEDLVRMLGIDSSGLGMLANDTTGFHTLSAASDSDDGGDARPASYYLYCGAYKFLWSYNPRRRSTMVLAFMLSAERSPKGMKAYLEFVSCLRQGASIGGLAGHPLLVPLSALAQTVAFTERTLRSQYDKCRIAEESSGVHPWLAAAGPEEQGKAVRELADIARQMTALVVEGEMILRRIRQWRMAIAAYEDMQAEHEHRDISSENTAAQRREVTDALRLMGSKLDVMEIDFVYARERARNQMAAVTQIMTRDDTLASIEIARAASRDGASMKVVAIMTMAFLPGTFLAALFAVPSLRWEDDANTVIGRRFWVYWAFTLPLTVVVFGLWAGLTKGEKVLKMRPGKSKPGLGRPGKEAGQIEAGVLEENPTQQWKFNSQENLPERRFYSEVT